MHPDGAFHFNPARYDIPLRASADCSDSNDKRIQRIIVSGNIGLQAADYGCGCDQCIPARMRKAAVSGQSRDFYIEFICTGHPVSR